MAHVLGQDAKLYRNTGSYASPVWDEVTLVKDCTLTLDKSSFDVTTRSSGGWTEEVDGLKTASIDFNHLWDTGNADFTAFRTSFTANSAIEVLCLDGGSAVAGSQGLRAHMMTIGFTRNEPLDGALNVDIRLKPVKNANAAPAWFTAP